MIVARMLHEIRKQLREAKPADIERVWGLRELEEQLEAHIDATAGLSAKSLREYLEHVETHRRRDARNLPA
jgi:hypothetical protein